MHPPSTSVRSALELGCSCTACSSCSGVPSGAMVCMTSWSPLSAKRVRKPCRMARSSSQSSYAGSVPLH